MAPLLPREVLALQLETLELAQSMFPELDLDEDLAAALPCLRSWIEAGGEDELNGVKADELAFTLRLLLGDAAAPPFTVDLRVRIPLTAAVDAAHTLQDGAPAATVHLQQPAWLSRTSHDGLAASLPSSTPRSFSSNADLLFETIDFVRNEAISLLPAPDAPPTPNGGGGGGRRGRTAPPKGDEPEFRVWLWFPSLSMREKRDDIVNWAPDYHITGFVLAGKPAIMCLEGTESSVQAYLSDIKANSWADIPSFQKKVSERYRTPLLPPPPPGAPPPPNHDPTQHRLFAQMSEITALIPRTGGRANRGEMGEVRNFLADKGLGEAFGAVIGGGQFS